MDYYRRIIFISRLQTKSSGRVKRSWDEECKSLGLLRRVVVVAGAVGAVGAVDASGCVGTIGAVDTIGAVGAVGAVDTVVVNVVVRRISMSMESGSRCS